MPLSSLYVTVSTGIGTGITTNGTIDSNFRLSEGGHMVVEYEGNLQMWETFASGKAIHEKFGLYAHDIEDPKIWDDIAERISRGLLIAIPFLQMDMIILGGSIGTYFKKYDKKLIQILKANLEDGTILPKIVQAKHPEQAVIYGCYYYAVDALND